MSEYKKINGVLHVKHLFRKWQPLMEHMKKKHPKAYKELQKGKKKKEEEKQIRKIGNMVVLKEKRIKPEYIVIKIGEEVYSTTDFEFGFVQEVNTIGVGKQNNLWIKGFFKEGKNHKKLNKKVPFEFNIYTKK